jgi:hypothetical protein
MVSVGGRVDELYVDAYAVAGSLHAAFKNAPHAELLGDLLQTQVTVAETLDGCARNDPESTHLRQLRQDVVVDAVDEEGVIGLAAAVLEGQHGDGWSCILCPGRRCVRLSRGCGGSSIFSGFAGALVIPERPATEQQKQRENRELGGGDALLAPVAVVPREDQDDGQADQECEGRVLLNLARPVVGAAEVLEALQEPPGGGDVDHSPLHHLPAAQPGPRAIASTLCRRVVHSAAPMSRAV